MKLSDVTLPSNKKFGYFFSFVFIISGIYFVFTENQIIATILLMGSFFVFLLTITKSELLLPFNKFWMRLGLFLGLIVSPIIMGIIFFSIFTPLGILMRISGRDILGLRVRKKPSFWNSYEESELFLSSFKKQF